MVDTSELVFVYGTLKRGFPNHHFMEGATFLGMARTVDAYPLVLGGDWFTPNLMPEPGEGYRVIGEVWRVPAALMPALDELESVHLPNGYRRATIPLVYCENSEPVHASVYFRERRFIKGIRSEPMADYQDRRYVAAEDRD